ncbi:MAG TPA: PAS domain S-box protein [Sedimenticola sp.]|nr:PAS domain S-box protein [Sedimenticola sp.]
MSEQNEHAAEQDKSEEALQNEIILDFYAQQAVTEILHISLEPVPLQDQLQRIIEFLTAIPWLAGQGKGAIFLLDEQGQNLEMKAQHGLGEQLIKDCKQISLGHCLCGRAAQTGEVIFKSHLDEQHEITYEGIGDHGHYCVPIVARGRTFGVLNLYVDAGHVRERIEEQLLVTVANTVGKIVEHSMARRELQYQKFAMDQHANVGIMDVTGKIIYANDRFCEDFGYDREELIGRNHSILKSDQHPESFYQEMWDTIAAGTVWHGEVCSRTKSGSLIWLDTTVVPFLDPAGKPYKYVSICRNISNLKDAERELSEKGAFLQNITYSMGDGVITDNAEGRIAFANAEAISLLACDDEEDLIGKDMYSFLCGGNEEDGPRTKEESPLYKALHTFRTYRDEDGVFYRSDGTALPVAYVGSPMVDDSGYAGSIIVFRDITARKQAEKKQQELIDKLQDAHSQLLQSEKMASIGQLAAGVAHEINNPVGYVNSNLGSLKQYVADLFSLLDAYKKLQEAVPQDSSILREVRDLEQELDLDFLKEDIGSLLEESDEGIRRVKQIVNDLKDFSRLDSTEWHWADLEAGLDSTLNIVHNEIKYKAEVVKEYAGIPQIECIGSQLNQVFMNLMVNGVHAIEERGTITIRTGMEGNDWVWVEVADTGKGIEPDALSRIFDPFYTTKPVGKGTGLGLSLSYSIVERHGGEIGVQSEVGKGTCFRVRLPVKQAKKTESSAENETAVEEAASAGPETRVAGMKA